MVLMLRMISELQFPCIYILLVPCTDLLLIIIVILVSVIVILELWLLLLLLLLLFPMMSNMLYY